MMVTPSNTKTSGNLMKVNERLPVARVPYLTLN
jgi:hypothetical protein